MSTTTTTTTARKITTALINPVLEIHGTCEIEETTSGGITFITLRPMTTDITKIVGKGGVNIRALQALVEFHGRVHNRPTRLILADARPGPCYLPTERNEAFYPTEAVALAQLYLREVNAADGVQPIKRSNGGYLLAIAAELPPPIWTALGRWLMVVALRHGGYASLEPYGTAHPA